MGIQRLSHASWVDVGGNFQILATAAPSLGAGSFLTMAELGVQRVVYLLGAGGLEGMYGGEQELASHYLDAGIQPHWVPTPNLGVPASPEPMAAALEFLFECGSGHGAVHCRYGVGRTGLTLACAMVARGAASQTAIDSLARQRGTSLQSQAQRTFLTQFATLVRARAEGAHG